MGKKVIWLLFLGLAFLIFPLAPVPSLHTASARQEEEKREQGPTKEEWELLLPEGEGKSYVLALCQTCHTLRNLVLRREDESGWRSLIRSMSSRGANFYDEDIAIIAGYLAEYFGPKQPLLEIPLDLNKASLEQLALFPQLTKEDAAKIVEVGKKKGFKDIADLKQVLSDEKISKIKPFIVVR